MENVTDAVCLKAFYRNGPVQAVYGGRKTQPDLSLGGTNEHFLTTNQYTMDLGRNLNAEDVELGRPVAVIGQNVIRKLFPPSCRSAKSSSSQAAPTPSSAPSPKRARRLVEARTTR
jgi:hypothetical protein